MDSHSHRVAERCVHCLMAFNETFTIERITDDQRLEVITASCGVTHLDVSSRQAYLD
jgi:hypothetical protein